MELALIVANWELILLGAIVVAFLGLKVKQYIVTPSEKKQELILEWLSQAVVIAEYKFGTKAGKAKLSYVYQMFVKQYGILGMLMSEKLFNELVDKALAEVGDSLENSLRGVK